MFTPHDLGILGFDHLQSGGCGIIILSYAKWECWASRRLDRIEGGGRVNSSLQKGVTPTTSKLKAKPAISAFFSSLHASFKVSLTIN